MAETPFYEKFDTERREEPARDRRRVIGAIVLGALLFIGIVGFVWFGLLRSDSKSSGDLLNDALAAHVEGRLADAAKIYDQILQDEPGNKLAHYNLGLIAQTQGRLEDADREYRAALVTDPAYGPALFNLAVMEYEAGNFEESVSLYRMILVTDPDSASAHLNLGFSLKAAGKDAEGDREIAIAVGLDPSLAAQVPTTETTIAPFEETTTTTAD